MRTAPRTDALFYEEVMIRRLFHFTSDIRSVVFLQLTLFEKTDQFTLGQIWPDSVRLSDDPPDHTDPSVTLILPIYSVLNKRASILS